MRDEETTILETKNMVKEFCDERNWRQFHDAKELAIGITTEAGELLEHFRFKSKEDIDNIFSNTEKKEEISHELADVYYFVLRFAEMYNIDLANSLANKIRINEARYPLTKSKDNNKKYSEY
jgi:NTP pyrophosphatase (non-canonical NTP hydrolase)